MFRQAELENAFESKRERSELYELAIVSEECTLTSTYT